METVSVRHPEGIVTIYKHVPEEDDIQDQVQGQVHHDKHRKDCSHVDVEEENEKPMDLTNRQLSKAKVPFRVLSNPVPKIKMEVLPNEELFPATNHAHDYPNTSALERDQVHFINNILRFNSQHCAEEMKQYDEMKPVPYLFQDLDQEAGHSEAEPGPSGSGTLQVEQVNCASEFGADNICFYPEQEDVHTNREGINEQNNDEIGTSANGKLQDDNGENVENEEPSGPACDDDKIVAVNNQVEVMRAAKALFSKKTRTLYHWMYPNTPKFQLKSAVSMAWDAMGLPEKQFYVSQVLGKFGCVENRLMINPQLGFLSTPTTSGSPQPTVPITTQNQSSEYQIQGRPVACNLFLDRTNLHNITPVVRKRGRPRGPSSATIRAMQQFAMAEFKNFESTDHHMHQLQQQLLRQQYEHVQQHVDNYHQSQQKLKPGKKPPSAGSSSSGGGKRLTPMLQDRAVDCPKRMRTDDCEREQSQVQVSAVNITEGAVCKEQADNDFTDDPELKKELEKFQWALHMLD